MTKLQQSILWSELANRVRSQIWFCSSLSIKVTVLRDPGSQFFCRPFLVPEYFLSWFALIWDSVIRAFHTYFSECCLWLNVLTDYRTLKDFVCVFDVFGDVNLFFLTFGSTRFLASDEASFITAQDITVDGGITSLGRWAKVTWHCDIADER